MREVDGGKNLPAFLRRMIIKKEINKKPCTLEPAKRSSLWASLSWQLLGAPPKAGSGKHKGSLCKTFSKRKWKKKVSVNVFLSYREWVKRAQNRSQAWAS